MSEVEAGAEQSEAAGERIVRALNVTGKPTVDTSDLQAALQVLRQANAEMQKLLNGVGQAAAAAQSAGRAAGHRARSQFSDGGI